MFQKKIYFILFSIFISNLILGMNNDLERRIKTQKYSYTNLCNAQWQVKPPKTFRTNNIYKVIINNNHVIYNENNKIITRDIKTGHEIQSFDNHKTLVTEFILTSDAQYIISTSLDKNLKIWEYKTGKEITSFKVSYPITKLACTPDNQKIIFASETRLKIIDFKTSDLIYSYNYKKDIKAIDCNNKYVLINFSNSLLLINLETRESIIFDHTNWGTFFSKDETNEFNSIILTTTNNNILIWNMNEKKFSTAFEGHKGWINLLTYTPNKNLIASFAFDTTIRIWNIKKNKEIFCIDRFTEPIKFLKFINNRYLIIILWNNKIQIWDMKKKQLIKTFENENFFFGEKILIDKNNKYIISYKNVTDSLQIFELFTLTTKQKNLFKSISNQYTPIPDPEFTVNIPNEQQSTFEQLNKELQGLITNSNCPICIESIYDSNHDSELPHVETSCGHLFHKTCLDTWMLEKHNCPLCKKWLFNTK